jgi:uncharacterized protein (UPF0333 family)
MEYLLLDSKIVTVAMIVLAFVTKSFNKFDVAASDRH